MSLPPLRVKVLAHGQGLPLPAYQTAGAAGLDLMSAVELTLDPGGRAAVPTGLSVAIPEGFEGQVRPRSGLAIKHGVTVVNAPGTIDSDYRGEVSERHVIERGARVAQLVLAPVVQLIVEVGALDETARGAGGFGSTGA